MKNISVSQLIVLLLVGILLFSDFSKILKILRNWFKNNVYKIFKKK